MPSTSRRKILFGSNGLIAAVLFACQPLPPRHLDWEIANQTADTLVVTTRYALDSAVVPPTEIAAMSHANGDLTLPMNRIVRHKGVLYRVHEKNYNGILVIMYDNMNHISRWAQVDAMHGRVTYLLPPGETQPLVETGYQSLDWKVERQNALPFVELRVQQGKAQRVLSADDFEELQNKNGAFLVRATIGTDLLILR